MGQPLISAPQNYWKLRYAPVVFCLVMCTLWCYEWLTALKLRQGVRGGPGVYLVFRAVAPGPRAA